MSAAVSLPVTDAVLAIESLLLGPLEIRTDTIITFAAGLPGFAALRRFALIETQRDDLVWLQSIDEPELALLLADPFAFVPGLELEIPPSDLAAMGASGSADALLVLTVAQLHGGAPCAINLQSPIVIDRDRRQGRQVVLPDSTYGMQFPITFA